MQGPLGVQGTKLGRVGPETPHHMSDHGQTVPGAGRGGHGGGVDGDEQLWCGPFLMALGLGGFPV